MHTVEVTREGIATEGMKSVPPRGSGWVDRLPIFNCRLPIARLSILQIGNRKLAIGNAEAHPLPRGGSDFIALDSK